MSKELTSSKAKVTTFNRFCEPPSTPLSKRRRARSNIGSKMLLSHVCTDMCQHACNCWDGGKPAALLDERADMGLSRAARLERNSLCDTWSHKVEQGA